MITQKKVGLPAALPETRVALRELTKVYEVAHYGGRLLNEAQREAALIAFDAMCEQRSEREGALVKMSCAPIDSSSISP
jgi:hypothetical protein